MYWTKKKENRHLETNGRFNVNGLFLSGRCRYVSIYVCFHMDAANASARTFVGVCLPLFLFPFADGAINISDINNSNINSSNNNNNNNDNNNNKNSNNSDYNNQADDNYDDDDNYT